MGAYAQTTIKGKVTDTDGLALPGANVVAIIERLKSGSWIGQTCCFTDRTLSCCADSRIGVMERNYRI